MRVSKKSQPGRVSEYGVTPAREPYLNMMATADREDERNGRELSRIILRGLLVGRQAD